MTWSYWEISPINKSVFVNETLSLNVRSFFGRSFIKKSEKNFYKQRIIFGSIIQAIPSIGQHEGH